jgi:hypothetical protein
MKSRIPSGDFGKNRAASFNVGVLKEEEMYELCEHRDNPPAVGDSNDEAELQAEIRTFYDRLVGTLCVYGEEGDYYGISDFAVRPDLRDGPTVRPPPAPPVRQFLISVLTEKYYRSEFLRIVKRFLQTDGQRYRVIVDQDFNSKWHLWACLTPDSAQIYCSETDELKGLMEKLSSY